MAPRPTPHIAAPSVAPSRPSGPPAASERLSRRDQIEQRAQQHQQQIQQRQEMVQQRQREMLSRQTTERQTRIDRLQQRVQQLQSQKPEGARALREQQRTLQTQNRLLEREQRAQQSDLARQQRLGLQAPAARATATAAAAAAAAQAAQRGRFAERFREQAPAQAQAALTTRQSGWAPRQAWRHRHPAVFVAWLGPVFWPYAYSDIFDYTFWSYAYEPGYWAYAYDDFVDTVFWGGDSPYSAYASINPYDYPQAGGGRVRQRASVSPQTLQQLCGTPDKGVTAWPLADIARAVRPTPEQRALLDELKTAAANAAGVFKDSCAETYALTPPGRLRAMMNRINATLEAVKIVRPALENFYNSLSDEQQASFNALGPNVGERSPQQQASAEGCGDPKSGLTQLPIQRIEAVLHPAGRQKEALDRLSEATAKGVEGLQAACPNDVPLTPVGRLEAMQHRLEAMLTAARLVEPALDEFYATLSSEQKARFNTLQQVAGQ
ncbi:Spy/CpxP family protein refolding chaperone [Bradyrhizobium iriomotense]|uniref:Spy/CpxP family protein refolding chaperone n=1 Tax=Bradyrhizobium iriomotense TaxID=441950 RepID=UPI001FE68916|nr:Spy/CpxP family protein refolding chaperone [Bradyrhizobium iriomotense]